MQECKTGAGEAVGCLGALAVLADLNLATRTMSGVSQLTVIPVVLERFYAFNSLSRSLFHTNKNF